MRRSPRRHSEAGRLCALARRALRRPRPASAWSCRSRSRATPSPAPTSSRPRRCGPTGSTATAASTASASSSRPTTTRPAPTSAPRPSSRRSRRITAPSSSAGWDSTVVLAEIEQAHKLHTPFFVSYAWSSEITQKSYPEVVRIGPNLDQLANAFAPFMKARGYRTVAIVKDDTAYSQGLGTSLGAAATQAGITARTVVYKRDSHDLRPQLRGLLARKPDALIVAGVVAPGLTLAITQARALGYRNDILLGWDFVDDAFWKATGKHGTGVIWPTFSAPAAPHDRRPDVQASLPEALQAHAAGLPGLHLGSAQRLEMGGRHGRIDRRPPPSCRRCRASTCWGRWAASGSRTRRAPCTTTSGRASRSTSTRRPRRAPPTPPRRCSRASRDCGVVKLGDAAAAGTAPVP